MALVLYHVEDAAKEKQLSALCRELHLTARRLTTAALNDVELSLRIIYATSFAAEASFAVLWMTTRVGVRVYGHLMAYLSFGTRFSLIGTIAPPYAFMPRILTLPPFVPRLKGSSTV